MPETSNQSNWNLDQVVCQINSYSFIKNSKKVKKFFLNFGCMDHWKHLTKTVYLKTHPILLFKYLSINSVHTFNLSNHSCRWLSKWASKKKKKSISLPIFKIHLHFGLFVAISYGLLIIGALLTFENFFFFLFQHNISCHNSASWSL